VNREEVQLLHQVSQMRNKIQNFCSQRVVRYRTKPYKPACDLIVTMFGRAQIPFVNRELRAHVGYWYNYVPKSLGMMSEDPRSKTICSQLTFICCTSKINRVVWLFFYL
jgi:hypothetical protein